MFDIVCVTSLPADYIEIDSISVRSDPHMQGLRLRAATCERLPAGKGLLTPSDAFASRQVRGDLGPMTVWQTAGGFAGKHASPERWSKVCSGRLPWSSPISPNLT